MSLARRTSVAAVAVTACTFLTVLALVTTLVASGSTSSASTTAAAERGSRSKADAHWVSRAGLTKVQHQAARRAATKGARFRSFTDRILGAQPVLSYRGAADPTVARYPGGWVAVSTGPGAPRALAPQPGGPWQNIPSALTVQPSWAISGRYWASDLVQVNGIWLLYFSAEVAGLGLDGRCIGVATATDPTGAFVPDERPLVCPKQAATPPAYDRIKRRPKGMPRAGVIDPDYFKDKGGHQYLLYRTQSTPSSIRMVKLPGSGLPQGKARSTELIRRGGVIENPTLLRRGRQYVLLTSEGDFGECSYKTTFRRTSKLEDWSRAKRQVLVDSKKSGLCGPGGADVGRGANGEPMLFFHAWTCPDLGGNCPGGNNYDRSNLYDARRSLFAGVLRFTGRQSPRISSYVAPILPPPPPPTPTPTPTPTESPSTTVKAKPQGTKHSGR
jgi:arabinan endo-1,5-alpha-L-arabinosidase